MLSHCIVSALPEVLYLSCQASVKLLEAKMLFQVGLKLGLSLKVCKDASAIKTHFC